MIEARSLGRSWSLKSPVIHPSSIMSPRCHFSKQPSNRAICKTPLEAERTAVSEQCFPYQQETCKPHVAQHPGIKCEFIAQVVESSYHSPTGTGCVDPILICQLRVRSRGEDLVVKLCDLVKLLSIMDGFERGLDRLIQKRSSNGYSPR